MTCQDIATRKMKVGYPGAALTITPMSLASDEPITTLTETSTVNFEMWWTVSGTRTQKVDGTGYVIDTSPPAVGYDFIAADVDSAGEFDGYFFIDGEPFPADGSIKILIRAL